MPKKSMYDKGWLKLIQSVGYPSHNRSHFSSKDIMSTGNDGNSWLNGDDSGWIGRFMELNYADELNASYPLAVQIGSKSIALDFIGDHNHISTGAILNGEVKIKKNTFIGSGVIVFNNITIGENCIVSAGSIIKKDLPDNSIIK